MTGPGGALVVGGGIVGLCVAHALARRNWGRVTLVERDRCGQGSTARATGGIRTQFGTAVNVRLSLLALDRFRRWEEVYGGSAGYRPVGYLFLATSPEQMAALEAGARVQRECGARAELLTLLQARERLPGVDLAGVVGAAFGPDDGIGDPGSAVNSLLSACRRLGVAILEETNVTRLGVGHVASSSGDLEADVIVLAAGAWSGALAATVGFDLPITPRHRQVYRAGQLAGLAVPSPLVVDLGSGVYFHTDGGGLVFGGGDRHAEAGFDDRVRPAEAPAVIELLTKRLPQIRDAPLTSMWAGLREMTPDDLGVVGRLPGAVNVYVAAGFSGHGFMHAPAVGELLALLIAGERLPIDLGPLSPARFRTALRGESHVF